MLDFWINGVSAFSKGIYTEAITPPPKASRRTKLTAVPGRSGYIATGDESLNSYVRYVTCFVPDNGSLGEVWSFFMGAETVRFSTDPAHQLDCICVDQVDPEAFTLGSCSFTVGFTCQPYRYKYPEADAVTLTTSGGTVTNSGSVASLPRIKVTAAGDFTLTVGGELIEVTGGSIIIDSELQDCLDADGALLANSRVTLDAGSFPRLNPGANVVSWTGGVTKVEVTKRERDL